MTVSAAHHPSANGSDALTPCAADPDRWFIDSPVGIELAKSRCRPCPVRYECLTGALERAEPWGVWGGELFVAGRVVRRKRPRGRPRKTRALTGDA